MKKENISMAETRKHKQVSFNTILHAGRSYKYFQNDYFAQFLLSILQCNADVLLENV